MTRSDQQLSMRVVLGISGGVATIVLGIIVLVWPAATLVVLAVLFGIQLLILGIVRIVIATRIAELVAWFRTLAVITGVLTAIAGIICILHPFTSLNVLILLTAAGWLIDGIGSIIGGRAAYTGASRSANIATGVVFVLAALTLFIWPGLGLLTLVYLAGWTLIILGVIELLAALRHRSSPRRAATPAASI